ncbi:MAG: hypothetical protein QM723_10350 [Myxococcaceae bacterium]
MKKFMVLYVSTASAREQMAKSTPEQGKAAMEMWMTWMKKMGAALIDAGSPLSGTNEKIGGFSILQGESVKHIETLLKDHPHTHAPGATFEIYEFLQIPGM